MAGKATKAKRERRVKLPMATWHRLARRLPPVEFCVVLEVLRADNRVWSAAAAHALNMWSWTQAMHRKRFASWRPTLGEWGGLAHMLAGKYAPLRLTVIWDIREMLIETGSVSELFRLDAMYGKPATGNELKALADALYAGHERADWTLWGQLVQTAENLYGGDVAQHVCFLHDKAVSDANFDG
jgi:hypothetical protein